MQRKGPRPPKQKKREDNDHCLFFNARGREGEGAKGPLFQEKKSVLGKGENDGDLYRGESPRPIAEKEGGGGKSWLVEKKKKMGATGSRQANLHPLKRKLEGKFLAPS